MASIRQTIPEGADVDGLRRDAIARAAGWGPARRGGRKAAPGLKRQWRKAWDSIQQLPTFGLLREHNRLLRTVFREAGESLASSRDLPHVEAEAGCFWPRAYVASAAYLDAVHFKFDEVSFLTFLDGVQTDHSLEMGEIWALQPMLQLALFIAMGSCADDE